MGSELRRRARALLAALLLLALGGLSPASLRAQGASSGAEREAARRLMDTGHDKFKAGDYEAALAAYRSADEIMQGVPTTSFAVGRALAELGRLVDARAAMERVIAWTPRPGDPPAFERARQKAHETMAQLDARTPTLAVRLGGLAPGAQPSADIDGKPLPLRAVTAEGAPATGVPPPGGGFASDPMRVDPGTHRVTVTAPGYISHSHSFELKEGDRRLVELEMKAEPPPAPVVAPPAPSASAPAPPPPPTPPPEPAEERGGIPTLAWIGFGVAGAGVIAGTVTGLLAIGKVSDLGDACGEDDVCPPELEDDYDSMLALANASNVSFALAGAGAAVAIIALVAAGGGDTARVELAPAVGGATLRARF
jgi:hypothetical protein